MRKLDTRSRPRPGGPHMEIVLRLPDGSPWPLTVSPGMEMFIGPYPRVEGIDSGGPLLRFRIVHTA